jgi:RimJ/RimL family protein N-acetyltransferase
LALCVDPDAFAFLRKSYPAALTPASLFDYFLRAASASIEGGRVWAVQGEEAGELLGHLELKSTDKTMPGEGELVGFVAPAKRRMGVASVAVELLMTCPDLAPEFDRVIAYCRPSNAASVRLLQRAGFASVPSRSTTTAVCLMRYLRSRHR